MMDMRNVNGILIPEGKVLCIHSPNDAETETIRKDIIWLQPPVYPRMILTASGQYTPLGGQNLTIYSNYSIDKNGIHVASDFIPKDYYWDKFHHTNAKKVSFANSVIKNLPPTRLATDSADYTYSTILPSGFTFSARRIDSASEMEGSNVTFGDKFFDDAVWRCSDTAGEDVLLWGVEHYQYNPLPYMDKLDLDHSVASVPFPLSKYQDIHPSALSQAVRVSPGSQAITLSSNRGGQVVVTSVRSNFREYIDKFDEATSGIYRNVYSWIGGYIWVDVSSASAGINTITPWGHQGFWFYFVAAR